MRSTAGRSSARNENAVAQGDRLKCYEIVTSRILPLADWNWETAAGTCSGVEAAFTSACFRSLGRDVAGFTKHDPVQALSLCAVGRPFGGEGSCVAGVAIATSATFTDGKRAAPLCSQAPADVRGDCYFAIGSVTALLEQSAAARAAKCRSVTSDAAYRARCIAGASALRPLTVA